MMKDDEGWMQNDEGWKMKDEDFKLLKGFALWQTNERTNGRTDICDCRVAFATENWYRPGSVTIRFANILTFYSFLVIVYVCFFSKNTK